MGQVEVVQTVSTLNCVQLKIRISGTCRELTDLISTRYGTSKMELRRQDRDGHSFCFEILNRSVQRAKKGAPHCQ